VARPGVEENVCAGSPGWTVPKRTMESVCAGAFACMHERSNHVTTPKGCSDGPGSADDRTGDVRRHAAGKRSILAPQGEATWRSRSPTRPGFAGRCRGSIAVDGGLAALLSQPPEHIQFSKNGAPVGAGVQRAANHDRRYTIITRSQAIIERKLSTSRRGRRPVGVNAIDGMGSESEVARWCG